MKKNLFTILTLITISLSSFAAATPIISIAKIESSKEVIHSSDAGGKITGIYYDNGDYVKKGTVIMTIQNDQVSASFEQAENQYLIAKASYEKTKKFSKDQQMLNLERAEKTLTASKMSLQKAQNGTKQDQIDQLKLNVETTKINFETNKKTFDKNQILYNNKSISEQTYLQIKTQYETSENSYKSAQKSLSLAQKGTDDEDLKTLKASVTEAQESYNVTKKMIDQQIWNYDIKATESAMNSAKAAYNLAIQKNGELSVKAECNGFIVGLDVVEGNKTVSGKTLFSVINVDTMIVKVGVPEKSIATFNKNSKVDIFVSALNKHFSGIIATISPRANEKTKKFEVKIKLKNDSHLLREGMHGEVKIN